MDRGRVLGHLRVRQKQTRGGRDPHVDTGAAMADEGVVIAHRVLPLRKGFSHSNKVGNTGPEVHHSKGPSPDQGLTNCWLLRGVGVGGDSTPRTKWPGEDREGQLWG